MGTDGMYRDWRVLGGDGRGDVNGERGTRLLGGLAVAGLWDVRMGAAGDAKAVRDGAFECVEGHRRACSCRCHLSGPVLGGIDVGGGDLDLGWGELEWLIRFLRSSVAAEDSVPRPLTFSALRH